MKKRLHLVLIFGVLSACGKDDVQTYRLEKEGEPAAAASGGMTLQPGMAVPDDATRKGVSWNTPPGWVEQPASQMRVGSFRVPGKDDRVSDVSIIPLGAMAGTDLQNINRWRGQINLAPVAETDLKDLIEKRRAGKRNISFVNMTGGGKRLAAGWFEETGRFWFVKMLGDDADVKEAQPALIDLIASINIRQ